VDAIVTGVHEPGDSHYELLRAFAGEALLRRMTAELEDGGYRFHEFGDSVLLARQGTLEAPTASTPTTAAVNRARSR
jgi:S-adenosylmethionine:tRNA ribosyltransferase-isomerase